eukprot:TRINITY_DN1598_c0_g1_i1.p1 TRINITY_DN1598_c0_g1~~TRINITY_DN1598_c0_g1_i1.p1  ORF type:complete len:348 (-),score=72.73 TRINITY_DN1598_c0_g1_i1:418-1416(-)
MNDPHHDRFLKILNASKGLKSIVRKSENKQIVNYETVITEFSFSNEKDLLISTVHTKKKENRQYKLGKPLEIINFNKDILSLSFVVESTAKATEDFQTDLQMSKIESSERPLISVTPNSFGTNEERMALSSIRDAGKPKKLQQFKDSDTTNYTEDSYSNVLLVKREAERKHSFVGSLPDQKEKSRFSAFPQPYSELLKRIDSRPRSNSQLAPNTSKYFVDARKKEKKILRCMDTMLSRNVNNIDFKEHFKKYKEIPQNSNVDKESKEELSKSQFFIEDKPHMFSPSTVATAHAFDSDNQTEITKKGEPLKRELSVRAYYVQNFNYDRYKFSS